MIFTIKYHYELIL